MPKGMTWSFIRLALFGAVAGGALLAVPVSYQGAKSLAEPLVKQYAGLLNAAAGRERLGAVTIQPVTEETRKERREDLAALKTKLRREPPAAGHAEALRSLRDARVQVRENRQRVMRALAGDREYRAAVAAVREGERQLAAATSEPQRYAAAQRLMGLRTEVTRMEAGALKADEKYAVAHEALVAASAALAKADTPAAERVAVQPKRVNGADPQQAMAAELGRMLSAITPQE